MGQRKHQGWEGQEYASNFIAAWGVVKQEEIFIAPDHFDHNTTVDLARSAGFVYVVTSRRSPTLQNRLYKIRKYNAICIYKVLEYADRNAVSCRQKYRSSADERIKQLVRVANTRCQKSGEPFDVVSEQIVTRAMTGVCEATGLPLDLENVHSPYGPSLDRTVPGGGYMTANVRVVANMYNCMKMDWSVDEVDDFLERWASSRGLIR